MDIECASAIAVIFTVDDHNFEKVNWAAEMKILFLDLYLTDIGINSDVS